MLGVVTGLGYTGNNNDNNNQSSALWCWSVKYLAALNLRYNRDGECRNNLQPFWNVWRGTVTRSCHYSSQGGNLSVWCHDIPPVSGISGELCSHQHNNSLQCYPIIMAALPYPWKPQQFASNRSVSAHHYSPLYKIFFSQIFRFRRN